MKLEAIEEAQLKREEIKGLRGVLAGAMNERKRGAEGVVGERDGVVGEGARKRGWGGGSLGCGERMGVGGR